MSTHATALPSIAMPFTHNSGDPATVINREPTVGSPREANFDYLPRKFPRALEEIAHGKAQYGLPCARCKAYYAAELTVCPICNAAERAGTALKKYLVCPASRSCEYCRDNLSSRACHCRRI
jgi:hypothetical protein